jgi:regulatory protein
MQPKRRWKRQSASSNGSDDPEASALLPSEQELYVLAVKALTRRPYPIRELKYKLSQGCSDSARVNQVIERLKDAGYLDDREYAELFIQNRRNRRGRSRIANELQARGINSELVKEVLDQSYPESGEQELLERALDKKLRTLSAPIDAKKRAKLYNHLLRCGFPSEAIRRELDRRFKTDWE